MILFSLSKASCLRTRLGLCGFAFFISCGEVAQQRVDIPLFVSGTSLSQELRTQDDLSVELMSAQLAFGPLYLCAGERAGDLCETARLEWLETTVIDGLASIPREVGRLKGLSGQVRSWMFDLGISSQYTRSTPYILPAAKELGGASIKLELRVQLEDHPLRIIAALPLQQTEETELGVPIIRKSDSEHFEHDVHAGDQGLLVRIDPSLWVKSINIGSILVDLGCDDATLECELPEQYEIQAGSRTYRGLRNSVLSSARPILDWVSK